MIFAEFLGLTSELTVHCYLEFENKNLFICLHSVTSQQKNLAYFPAILLNHVYKIGRLQHDIIYFMYLLKSIHQEMKYIFYIFWRCSFAT